jgi:outer membrane protein TolC
VLALHAVLAAQDRIISASTAGRWPRLTAGANYDYAKPNPNVFNLSPEPPWADTWAFFASVSWSPNDFMVAGKQRAQVQADQAQTRADLESLRDGLRREVVQAAEDYRSAGEAMSAALVGIRAAEESYRVRREQFRAGSAVATDVIESESDLRRSRLDLINAAIDARIARARLDRATETRGGRYPRREMKNQP